MYVCMYALRGGHVRCTCITRIRTCTDMHACMHACIWVCTYLQLHLHMYPLVVAVSACIFSMRGTSSAGLYLSRWLRRVRSDARSFWTTGLQTFDNCLAFWNVHVKLMPRIPRADRNCSLIPPKAALRFFRGVTVILCLRFLVTGPVSEASPSCRSQPG